MKRNSLELQVWLNLIVKEPSLFFSKVEQGALLDENLSSDEMQLVIGLVNANGTLHKLADKKNWTVLKILAGLGADIFVKDSLGNCLLTKIDDIVLFNDLLQRQPLPADFCASLLKHLHSILVKPVNASSEHKALWIENYKKVFVQASLDDLLIIYNSLCNIMQHRSEGAFLIDVVVDKFSSLVPQQPTDQFYVFMVKFFKWVTAYKNLAAPAFKYLLEKNILPNWVIIEFLSEFSDFIKIAETDWKYDGEIRDLLSRFGCLDRVVSYLAV